MSKATTNGLTALRAAVQRVHTRYLVEVVEAMNICPFARKSRERGRVHRPVFVPGPERVTPGSVAAELATLVRSHDDAEIVLLTFVVGESHPFAQAPAFEDFLKQLREAWDALPAPSPWYMVSFHPKPKRDESRALTPDNLVPLLRRSPDPVIQCVNAETLDAVRREAQRVSHERMMTELREKSPELAELFSRSIQADPELGADIAQHNFDACGTGDGRAKLEATLRSISDAREVAYTAPEFAELALGLGLDARP